jgi:hypothetical protein
MAETTLAIHSHDCPIFRAFFEKHALGPKALPSCLVCGRVTVGDDVAIQHMELPAIVVCAPCRNAALRANAGSTNAAAAVPGTDALNTTEAPSKLTQAPPDEPIEYRLDHDSDHCSENCKGH